jgi:ABC-type antimicrobial peptide transport system permease subunit
MRAMGAGGWDVGGIFFTESLILIALAAVVSCLLLGGAAVAGNWLIKEEFGILTSLLSVEIRQIGLIVGLALTVSALAGLIPIARLAAQKPIDVIRG